MRKKEGQIPFTLNFKQRVHTPRALKPFKNFFKLYTVACIVSVMLQFKDV